MMDLSFLADPWAKPDHPIWSSCSGVRTREKQKRTCIQHAASKWLGSQDAEACRTTLGHADNGLGAFTDVFIARQPS